MKKNTKKGNLGNLGSKVINVSTGNSIHLKNEITTGEQAMEAALKIIEQKRSSEGIEGPVLYDIIPESSNSFNNLIDNTDSIYSTDKNSIIQNNSKANRLEIERKRIEIVSKANFSASKEETEKKEFETNFLLNKMFKANNGNGMGASNFKRICRYLCDFEYFPKNEIVSGSEYDYKLFDGISNIGGVIRFIKIKPVKDSDRGTLLYDLNKGRGEIDELDHILENKDNFIEFFMFIFDLYKSNSEIFKKRFFKYELDYNYIPMKKASNSLKNIDK